MAPAMLKAPEGASVDEIVTAFSWKAHTVRGAIAGALKKSLGCKLGRKRSKAAAASTASQND